jgi:D-alanyl-D-alanine carboxypeptidase/D-alanyl-D-alanine-endopeptidase (penicillin-binding protein 4)
MKRFLPLLALALAAAPVPSWQDEVRRAFAAVPGARFGLVVADADGTELLAIAPHDRFVPASNTKVLTTLAAYALLPIDEADATGAATVRIDAGDVILAGHGDARLSSAPACTTDCLASLADAIAARTRRVRDAIGDDTAFPDERWSSGMSWNNMATRSGTGISALSLDDNELELTVRPGADGRAIIASNGYYPIDDRLLVAPGPTAIDVDRMPGTPTIRLSGTIAPDAAPQRLRVGIEDPAHYAAWRLAALLRQRGVRITGRTIARHRPADRSDDPARRGALPPVRPPEPPVLAESAPGTLAADIATINTDSQNLHAELLLRRLGRIRGTGSVADGIVAVGQVMASAGIPRTAWDVSDGSGMSTYNRVTPRGMVRLLGWAGRQPWAERWRATLPVAGQTGTLARRFRGTPLEGRLTAKTGSLSGTGALAGTLVAASGRTLTFAAYANDVPGGGSASAALDRALVAVAAAN